MHKRTIKYKDLDGNPVEDTFYFHLNKAEATVAQAMFFGANAQTFEQALERQELTVPIQAILDVILMSFGEKSADGKSFMKSVERRNWFSGTDAFGELFEEIASDPKELLSFLKGIMPEGVLDDVAIESIMPQDKPSGPPPIPKTAV